MILLPGADSAMMDPFSEHPTISFVCNVSVISGTWPRKPRNLKSSGLADTTYWGHEIEFL